MSSIEETKSRLMRGVVQDNINVLQNLQNARVTHIKRRRTRHWPWILGGVATAGTIYSAIFLFLVPAAKAPAVSAAPAAQDISRSEERRVGKEWRARRGSQHGDECMVWEH